MSGALKDHKICVSIGGRIRLTGGIVVYAEEEVAD